ncbi:hypothetical protein Pta02_55120 [Planobispora takensis]|uniref:Uncharacterized protein n=1 Tax=Planobispora takensis TaxID=1367882 RepID=A0A8J3WV17_9ACTN|nr:hypothetical protein Pta02_55120 [Planobispora takensis]
MRGRQWLGDRQEQAFMRERHPKLTGASEASGAHDTIATARTFGTRDTVTIQAVRSRDTVEISGGAAVHQGSLAAVAGDQGPFPVSGRGP